MIKTFTQSDLIRLLYHETSAEETKEITKALLCDAELQARYNELVVTVSSATEAELQPSAMAVLNILSYSKSFQEKHT